VGSKSLKQITISKEDAVFWMDKQGQWQNDHGPIEHLRIIKYFNSCIRKDDMGYFVHQKTENTEEKVYFSYEGTAIFVIGIKFENDVALMLNNGDSIILDPAKLYTGDDSLFAKTVDHLIKFNTGTLLKISKYLNETKEGGLSFEWKENSYPVQTLP
jgi:hypothetical protein